MVQMARGLYLNDHENDHKRTFRHEKSCEKMRGHRRPIGPLLLNYINSMHHMKSQLIELRKMITLLTIRPVARKGYRSIAHSASPHGLLTHGP